MEMLKVLEKYGVTLETVGSNPAEVLYSLRKEYEARIQSLTDSKVSTADLAKGIAESVGSVGENASRVSDLMKQIRSLINEVLDENLSLSLLLVDEVQSLKQEMMSERDYFVSKAVRSADAPKVSAEFTTTKQEASDLAEAIRNLFVLLKGTKLDRKKFPTKDSKTAGTIPDLPKIPRTPGESSNVVGRAVKIRRIRFGWKASDAEVGEFLPEGTLIGDVAHDYVSDRANGVVVDYKAIRSAVEDSGQDFFGETPWIVEFPTGVLTGWTPASEDDDDEDSDEDSESE
jgi:hypothetical protein